MRTFIAIDLPESIHAELARWQEIFRTAATQGSGRHEIRWTRPEGIHLTLKFLGEISPEQFRQAEEALSHLGPWAKFTVTVQGFGFFPDARRPRVFWAGVKAGPDLANLAGRVEEAMEHLGFARESRPYRPHLTLARFRAPRAQPALATLLQEQGEATLGFFDVSEFFLFESKLSPHGATYQKLARFPG